MFGLLWHCSTAGNGSLPCTMAEKANHAVAQSSTGSERPYRSHRIPACQFCRRRKSRCTRDIDGSSCHLCQTHGIECSTGSSSRPDQKRRRLVSAHHSAQDSSSTAWQGEIEAVDKLPEKVAGEPFPAPTVEAITQLSNTHSGHIVGPAAARDAQVLEQYISSSFSKAVSHARPNPYSVYSDDPRDPVVYMKVPRHRVAMPVGNGTCGFKQYETINKIFEPLSDHLFQL